MSLTVAILCSVEWCDDRCIGMDLEGSGRGLILYLPADTEKPHDKRQPEYPGSRPCSEQSTSSIQVQCPTSTAACSVKQGRQEGKYKKCAAYFAALKMEKAGFSEKWYLAWPALLPWRFRQQLPPKRSWLSAKLRGVTPQKTVTS
jgi:hypothetical protein